MAFVAKVGSFTAAPLPRKGAGPQSFLRRVAVRLTERQRWAMSSGCSIEIFTADGIAVMSFTIPAGFVFDFASVPRLLQPFVSDASIRSVASAAHDWLYHQGAPRALADAVFLVLLQHTNSPRFDQFVMFKSVEWFGGPAYKAHRRLGRPQKNPSFLLTDSAA